MNPEKGTYKLNAFQVIKQKMYEDHSKEEKGKVIEFLKQIYPLNLFDHYGMEEIYKNLNCKIFKKGDVLKDYD